jgi:hypothetical protein
MTVGTHHGAHEISFVRAMAFQSTTKFFSGSRWFLGFLKFITDKFGDLNLQEPESNEVIRSGTSRLQLAPVRVSLVNGDQPGHGLGALGETDSDPARGKADHTLAVLVDTIDPIYQSPS